MFANPPDLRPDRAAPRLGSDPARAGQPRVGMVSLGCPKALVDSERILTRLRAEGYAISPDYAGADAVIVNTCGFLDSAKAESLEAIGEALAENGRVIVTGCLGVEEGAIRAAHPGVLAVTGPHQYEAVLDAVHQAVPPAPDPKVDLIPAGRRAADAAALRLSEDLGGLQPQLPLLHHSPDAGPAGLAARPRGGARGGEAGRGGRPRAPGDQPGHLGLWRGSAPCRVGRRARPHHGPRARARRHGGLGAAALCLSLSACRRVGPADGGRAGAALSRHSVPACRACGAARHEAAGQRRQGAGEAGAVAGDLPRDHHPLDLHRRLSRRDRGRFPPSARMARGGAARPGRLLPVRGRSRRRGERPAGPRGRPR